jgi:hypothetical protein
MDKECSPNPDETAEAYCMSRLSRVEARQFEEHFLGCPRCAEEVVRTWEFIESFRRAAMPPANGGKRSPAIGLPANKIGD